MRSTLSFAARSCFRSVAFRPACSSCAARRLLSTESRQWSTPLAKQLSEAITVCLLANEAILSNKLLGYGSDSLGILYADVFDLRSRRLLHFGATWPRSIRPKGRLYNVTRDIPDIWGADWHMVCYRMDGTGTQEQGS